MLITLLNDGTLISIGYDNVKSSPRPTKWNLKVGGTLLQSQRLSRLGLTFDASCCLEPDITNRG